jgi:hypothetical protein
MGKSGTRDGVPKMEDGGREKSGEAPRGLGGYKAEDGKKGWKGLYRGRGTGVACG